MDSFSGLKGGDLLSFIRINYNRSFDIVKDLDFNSVVKTINNGVIKYKSVRLDSSDDVCLAYDELGYNKSADYINLLAMLFTNSDYCILDSVLIGKSISSGVVGFNDREVKDISSKLNKIIDFMGDRTLHEVMVDFYSTD